MASKKADLLCLSHLRWGFVYQRPQHLISRFARDRRVFFWEEPVWSDGDPRVECRTCDKSGVVIVTPHLAGGQHEEEVNRQLRQLLDEFIADRELQDFVLWYYTPMMLGFSHHLKPQLTVYDCMDELSLFKFAPPSLIEREDHLYRRADLVFTGGQSLWEAKKDRHPSVHAFPSSVDVPHFEKARLGLPEPADQAGIPHPRIGWAGVTDERMDLELLRQVAEKRPEWHFVMLGPVVKIDPATLPNTPNVHWLGGKSYDDLPNYMSSWDAAMMPFAHNDSTKFISPTKTPEYLAAGLPVVSTSIKDVVRPYGELELVNIGDTPEDFEKGIEAALNMNGSRINWAMKVDDFLSGLSWDKTWAGMESLMDEALSARNRVTEMPAVVTSLTRDRAAFDYLIVGAGYAGSVVAERMARKYGKRVLMVDRRPHIAGNAYDHYDENGILIHRYGPHIFHTNSKDVFDYLSQFTTWRQYEHRVKALVDGKLVPIPINLDTVNLLYGLKLSSDELEGFFAARAEKRDTVRTSEDVVVSKVGRELYEKMFRGYTRKQWNLDPSELDAAVTARIPVRTNQDDRYFTDTYQAMPRNGYTRMFENMLDHPNIKILLNTDWREVRDLVPYREVVYSGPIDEFFDFRFGKLPYRSLEFKHETHDKEWFQSAPVVNYPNENVPHTRITEFKYLTGQQHSKTSIVYEYPRAEGDPYYPVPRPENGVLYKKYQELADSTPDTWFVGRLATYKYYNMDQVVGQALKLVADMTGVKGRSEVMRTTAERTRAGLRA